MKNWEARGISENGALRAQKIFGCDANWILEGGSPEVQSAPWSTKSAITLSETGDPAPTSKVITLTEAAPYGPTPWPFSVAKERFAALPPEKKQLVDIYMRGIVEGHESPPKKTASE